MPKGSEELTNARKDEIINACAALYETMSFKEITLKEIGRQTSFTRTSIYNYFQTKEEIFLALMQREYEAWVDDLKKLGGSGRAVTPETFSAGLARTVERRERLLKLMSMNLYDVEDNSRLENLSVQGSVDTNSITVTYDAVNCGYADGGYEVRTSVTYEGKPVAEITCPLTAETGGAALWLGDEAHLWETGCGRLYELSVTLIKDGKEIDNIRSYCGVRKIEAKEGKILLNGKPLYQKLVLDQGYWKGSDLTPPSEEALVKDITDMMDMGFNGARKHQKVEDERFLYYADLYGYLVWAEMPSMYKNTEKSRAVFAEEWTLAVLQQKNHPCVITWVPFNESWGIEDVLFDVTVQNFVNDVYHLTKLLDDTRLVITNDGWEHTLSDVLTIHNYEQDGKTFHSWYDTLEKCCAHNWPEGRKGAFANGYGYKGQPVMITEFGGTAFVKDTVGINWGYGQGVKDDEEFLRRFEGLVTAIDDVPFMCGYCYTQVTDVQHEVNGLEDENHQPKFPKEKIKAILQRRGR